MGVTAQATVDRAALDAAVERFHERVSADPELVACFGGIDVRRMLARQLTLFALAARSPAQFASASK